MKPKIEVCYQTSNAQACQKTVCDHASFYEDCVTLLVAGDNEMREVGRVALTDLVYICVYES